MLRSTFLAPRSPRPIDALLYNLGLKCDVTFDRPLVLAGALDLGNWHVRFLSGMFNVTAAAAAGSIVTLDLFALGPGPPGDWVSFSPPPHDVVSAEGAAAPAFSEYPLHQ